MVVLIGSSIDVFTLAKPLRLAGRLRLRHSRGVDRAWRSAYLYLQLGLESPFLEFEPRDGDLARMQDMLDH